MLGIYTQYGSHVRQRGLHRDQVRIVMVIGPKFEGVQPSTQHVQGRPSRQGTPLCVSPGLERPFLCQIVPIRDHHVSRNYRRYHYCPLTNQDRVRLHTIHGATVIFPRGGKVIFRRASYPTQVVSFIRPNKGSKIREDGIVHFLYVDPLRTDAWTHRSNGRGRILCFRVRVCTFMGDCM